MTIATVVSRGYGPFGAISSIILRGLDTTGVAPALSIVTRGYGQFSNVHFVITRGYTSGSNISTGPLILIMDGTSDTKGEVQAYNDGVINVPNIAINNKMPVRWACIQIIKAAGQSGGKWIARPYKLAVQKNGDTIATVRSLWFGTRLTVDEGNADWVVIDAPQFMDTLS